MSEEAPKISKPFWIGLRIVANLVFLAGIAMKVTQDHPRAYWVAGAGFVLIVYSWLRPKM
ncbi:MAG: hypothetical protein CMJ78_02620 [Planctomycetaceae bacterium]|nr:hypothetical protein [Planctomycetaceae bacterium]